MLAEADVRASYVLSSVNCLVKFFNLYVKVVQKVVSGIKWQRFSHTS